MNNFHSYYMNNLKPGDFFTFGIMFRDNVFCADLIFSLICNMQLTRQLRCFQPHFPIALQSNL